MGSFWLKFLWKTASNEPVFIFHLVVLLRIVCAYITENKIFKVLSSTEIFFELVLILSFFSGGAAINAFT